MMLGPQPLRPTGAYREEPGRTMPLALFDARISVEIALPIARIAVLLKVAATFASTGKIVGL